jgi:hypothetical protein
MPYDLLDSWDRVIWFLAWRDGKPLRYAVTLDMLRTMA